MFKASFLAHQPSICYSLFPRVTINVLSFSTLMVPFPEFKEEILSSFMALNRWNVEGNEELAEHRERIIVLLKLPTRFDKMVLETKMKLLRDATIQVKIFHC